VGRAGHELAPACSLTPGSSKPSRPAVHNSRRPRFASMAYLGPPTVPLRATQDRRSVQQCQLRSPDCLHVQPVALMDPDENDLHPGAYKASCDARSPHSAAEKPTLAAIAPHRCSTGSLCATGWVMHANRTPERPDLRSALWTVADLLADEWSFQPVCERSSASFSDGVRHSRGLSSDLRRGAVACPIPPA